MKNFQATAQRHFSGKKSLRVSILIFFGLLILFGGIILMDKSASGVGAQTSQKTLSGEWVADYKRQAERNLFYVSKTKRERRF